MSAIVVRGARQHNLKNIDLEIPHGRLVVITGLSGSGKSSLAFDTLYAEGQRRYVESLSAYARQFLGQMEKPDVDSVEGLAPAISIQQSAGAHNPRSTVGTVTEVYDYLRLLFARVGVPHCFRCERTIAPQTVQEVVDQLRALPEGTWVNVLAPVVRGRKGEHRKELAALRRAGFVRVRVDGSLHDLADEVTLRRGAAHTIEAVVDRLVIRSGIEQRLSDSLEVAFRYGDDTALVDVVGEREMVFSRRFACAECGVSYPELSPRFFSFNSPYGACSVCGGIGSRWSVDPDLLFPAPDRSLREGALQIGERRGFAGLRTAVHAVGAHYGADLDAPVSALPAAVRQALLHGTGEEVIEFAVERDGRRHVFRRPFEGLVAYLERRYRETTSAWRRTEIERCMRERPCEECGGTRLRPECRFVRLDGRNIIDLSAIPVGELRRFLGQLRLGPTQQEIARQVLREIAERLGFLAEVGVDYLSLDRPSASLSGGESQRIRLATQIGSRLTGVLYILDEPSIGLHPRDTARLLSMLRQLRDLGNTVIVVEHDRDTILAAEEVIDMGPGAGVHGGWVVAQGAPEQIAASRPSVTGRYLAGDLQIPVPAVRRSGSGWSLVVRGACHNNLRHVTVEIPLGAMSCVTGVSGSGKSSLVIDTLYRALAQRLSGSRERPGRFDDMSGWQLLDKVIEIDQSPIGRTPRSNPATYTGLFGPVRELFAQRPEARTRGYGPARFSFNVRGGRCEACGGAGVLRIEMQLLPDVYVTCEVCGGRRYDRETLEVRYKGRNISEVLDLTAAEALDLFVAVPPVRQKLETLRDVGLDYLTLGQPATTLSGGEAQRLKLARELSRRATGRTLYVLDEPTTGLHFEDIRKLLAVLDRLVDAGNTVVVIEHNLDVVKCADYVLDLGPEGGEEGGDVVAAGPPEKIARCPRSHTGRFLRGLLDPVGTAGGGATPRRRSRI